MDKLLGNNGASSSQSNDRDAKTCNSILPGLPEGPDLPVVNFSDSLLPRQRIEQYVTINPNRDDADFFVTSQPARSQAPVADNEGSMNHFWIPMCEKAREILFSGIIDRRKIWGG